MSSPSPAETSPAAPHDPQAYAQQAGLNPLRIPRHIAIIMDGNGRWALKRNLPRLAGHQAGAKMVRNIVTECVKLGVDVLTLYSFSMENWKRPADEVGGLMSLYLEYLGLERETLLANNVRLVQLGRRDGLPADVLGAVDDTINATSHCTGLTLALALNYSSRTEITDAVQAIARGVAAGTITPDAIDEQAISDHLYTAGLPDPDLLIRTAGELRISNYLLWQISYAEMYVADAFWPEFDVSELHEALRSFASRNRRFGALDDSNS